MHFGDTLSELESSGSIIATLCNFLMCPEPHWYLLSYTIKHHTQHTCFLSVLHNMLLCQSLLPGDSQGFCSLTHPWVSMPWASPLGAPFLLKDSPSTASPRSLLWCYSDGWVPPAPFLGLYDTQREHVHLPLVSMFLSECNSVLGRPALNSQIIFLFMTPVDPLTLWQAQDVSIDWSRTWQAFS